MEATPDGYNLVKQIVKILDVAPRQVQIKVEFVTASVTDVDALGINFDLVPYPGVELSSGQGSGSFGGTITGLEPTFLQYATGNIVAQLFQTLTRTRGKVVQAPLITTTNNVTATIQINTQIPFFTTGVVSNGGVAGGTTQSSQANFLTLTTGLTITPRINSDDSVTMNLAPQITDTTGQASVGGIPPTIQQTLTTLRTVRSGDTMVLGGLVRKQETASSQRIPILSDIPYLGGLFRTRNKQVNDQELLIFVTPTIISDTNDSGTANANGGQNITVAP
ncbi:MAG: type II secretion system protein GspD [Janthinobacterium lividum]